MERPTGINMWDDESVKALAIMLAVNCVRNTVIEDYHAGTAETSQISDAEMKAFNIEVVDNLYTALRAILMGEPEEVNDMLTALNFTWPHNWDEPKIAEDMIEGTQSCKRLLGKMREDRENREKKDGNARRDTDDGRS